MTLQELRELLKIGLTDGEAKVYLALLELGSSTVGPVVKKSGIAYSNIYEVLQRLERKGIVSHIVKDKTKHFQAAAPTNILLYLEKKERILAKQKQQLRFVLPQLSALQNALPQQEAEIFTGKRGLRTAYEKLLSLAKKGAEDLFFYIHEPRYAQESDLFYLSIQELFRKIPTRGVSDKRGRSSVFLQKAKHIDMRYADFPIPGNMEVCGDRLMLVSWEQPVTAMLIHSQSMAEHFRQYFEAAWKAAKR